MARIAVLNIPWFCKIGGESREGIRAGSRWPMTQPRRADKAGYIPFVFGMGYAASRLIQAGHEVHMRDSIVTREEYGEFYHAIRTGNFDAAIIETASVAWEHDKPLIEYVKRFVPNVALCGQHATVYANSLVTDYTVFKGEYELAAVDWAESGFPSETVYLHNTVENLDESPFPYRDPNPKITYHYNDRFRVAPEGPALQMIASRNCPYKCSFCVYPLVLYGKRGYRYRSPENVAAELREILDRFPAFTSVYLDGDTENIGNDRMCKMSDLLGAIGLPWSMMTRIDTLRKETWQYMARNGLYAVKCGVESGSQRVLDDIIHKDLSLELVRDMAQYLKSLGIFVHYTFTEGLPTETDEELDMTNKLIAEIACDPEWSSYQLSGCAAIPGTDLYTQMIDEKGKVEMDGQLKIEKQGR